MDGSLGNKYRQYLKMNKTTSRIKQTGEVFTPRSLIREMLDKLPNSVWFDPNKTWLEPSAGDGNFLVEVKARLLQAGHDEKHILDRMLFSIELIDDNHWALQHRLGYLVDGNPNPKFWSNGENFEIAKIHPLTQDLNQNNPYHEKLGLNRDEVLHHRNHVCWTALEYDMSFGERDNPPILPLLLEKELGDWPETDTPDIGEKYVVEKMLGKQPQLARPESTPVQKKEPTVKSVKQKREKLEKSAKVKAIGGGWSVHPKFYGQGKIVETIFGGEKWVADHDKLVDDINSSLKEKGKKTLFEDPRVFGSSSGIRGGVNGGIFQKAEV